MRLIREDRAAKRCGPRCNVSVIRFATRRNRSGAIGPASIERRPVIFCTYCKHFRGPYKWRYYYAPDERPFIVSHEKRIVHCAGPQDAHAFDGIPVQLRAGDLDARCPVCAGYGQWNSEIDLASHRSKRHVCAKCDGRGWIETGEDLVPSNDVVMSPEGYPQWVVRLDPSDDVY